MSVGDPIEEPSKAKRGKKQKQSVLYRARYGRFKDENNSKLLDLLKPTEKDVQKLLAAKCHIGRRRSHVNMNRYIWKRRPDGIHIINLEKTWSKMVLAARIMVTVRNPSDICVMSTRLFGQRGAIKFAHCTGATPVVGKWTSGTFTNPQNKAFKEPRLLIVDDPSSCYSALKETSYCGIPVIALCGSDSSTRFVDCAIPCNNHSRYSIGLMFWLLARELLRMRGDPKCIRGVEWDQSVDLFFYRNPDVIQRQQARKQELAQQRKQRKAQRKAEKIARAQSLAKQQLEDEEQEQEQKVDEQQQQFEDNYDPMYGQPQTELWDEMPPNTQVEDWEQPQPPMMDQGYDPNLYAQQPYDENQGMGLQQW